MNECVFWLKEKSVIHRGKGRNQQREATLQEKNVLMLHFTNKKMGNPFPDLTRGHDIWNKKQDIKYTLKGPMK